MPTVVVNKNKNENYIFYVGRPTNWGNPFGDNAESDASIIVDSRETAIENYKKWLLGEGFLDLMQRERKWILDNLKYLKGKVIACSCKPKACHADVLAELADADVSWDNLPEKNKTIIKKNIMGVKKKLF